MKYSCITTQEAIHQVLSQSKPGEILSSQQITWLIFKKFKKKEIHESVARQLRRMTNEESRKFTWINRVGSNEYTYVENPVSLYALSEDTKISIEQFSDVDLLKELHRRLKSK